MRERTPDIQFPQAMENLGDVEEMGGIQGNAAEAESPMVEITRKEPWETADVMEEAEIREDR